MKNKFLLFIATVLLISIYSCGSGSKEDSKPKLSEELQTKLDSTEEKWSQLTAEMAKWSVDFSSEKANWVINRPMDSIKLVVEKKSAFKEILGDSWQKLYEQAEAKPAEVEQWAEMNMKKAKSLNDEATAFSEWKNKAESGEFDKKEIEEQLKIQDLKIEEGNVFLNDLKEKWNAFRAADKELLKSF